MSKDASRYADRRDGRKGAKDITKHRSRRRQRDNDHDLARRYNAGQRDVRDAE